MAPVIRIHPRTGRPLTPVGYTRGGRAIWPILGGDGTDPMARINELLAIEGGLEALTPEQFTELRTLLEAEATALRSADPSTLDVAHVNAVADNAQAVAAEATRREEANAAVVADVQAGLGRLNDALPAADPSAAATGQPAAGDPAAPAGQPAAGDPAAPSAGDPAADPATAQGDPAAADPAAAAPLAASAGRIVPLSQVVQGGTAASAEPNRPQGENGEIRRTGALVASAGRSAGEQIHERSRDEQLEDLASAFNEAFRDVRSGAPRGLVASSRYSLDVLGDDHRRLQQTNSAATNRSIMDAGVRALTASGGICRPVTVDYSIPLWANLAEPMKAALPSIDAPRGGLQYGLPQHYDVTVYGEGVDIWSEANDVDPGGSNTGPNSNPTGTGPDTKPCVEIDCGNFTEVDVEAITKCAVVSNFRGRFSPENVETLMTYLSEAFAAKSEIERLKQMRMNCTHNNSTHVFGFARDLLGFFDRLRAYYRSRYRLSDDVPLRVVMIEYIRELIRIDLRVAAFATTSDSIDNIMISNAQIDAYFASVGLTPTWVLDDDTGDQTWAAAGAGTQGAPVAFPTFPQGGGGAGTAKVRVMAYPEGTFQRLDGGQLDLGVIRDSALVSQNKYQVFSEVFEAVAMRGFEATDWTIDGVPNGAVSGTITPVAGI